MDKYTATEQAYKNGYEQGKKDAVKHGKWKLHKNGSGTCDQCNFTQKDVWDMDRWQRYCGVCGAIMVEAEGG